jgi:hypothetical protein
MTTEEHLTRIRNLFAKVEEMEKLATEKPWEIDPAWDGDVITNQRITIVQTYRKDAHANASLIALNRNIIVPLVKSAEIALRFSLLANTEEPLDEILALFPDELLTLCGV